MRCQSPAAWKRVALPVCWPPPPAGFSWTTFIYISWSFLRCCTTRPKRGQHISWSCVTSFYSISKFSLVLKNFDPSPFNSVKNKALTYIWEKLVGGVNSRLSNSVHFWCFSCYFSKNRVFSRKLSNIPRQLLIGWGCGVLKMKVLGETFLLAKIWGHSTLDEKVRWGGQLYSYGLQHLRIDHDILYYHG